MKMLLTRRRLIATGLAAAAGASGLAAAARLAERYGLIPPDHDGIYGVGETLTYGAHRLLTSRGSLAREFTRGEISKVAPVNGGPPESEEYERIASADFADWRLTVDGLVTRPTSFSLAELKRLPARSQITHQACEEGWSFIAEWTGVPLSYLLGAVGVSARARYVVLVPFDTYWDSLDIDEAQHPQTLLAYAMNGAALSAGHGAPLRVRVPRQLGYKSIKYLTRITAVDSLKHVRNGLGSASPDTGYSWYAGI
jgi:DMSO/TMAO reductase YedYZ molybdopterin-dependent catalytic subunit